MLNTNNTISILAKNSPIVALVPEVKCEQIQEIKLSEVTQEPEKIDLLQKLQLLPEIPGTTNLQLGPGTTNISKSIPDADICVKYNSIASNSVADIGRINLIELDIFKKGPPVASKANTMPLKYRQFVDHEIKQLQEAGTISRGMSDWASPILLIPKKEQ